MRVIWAVGQKQNALMADEYRVQPAVTPAPTAPPAPELAAAGSHAVV
jgi:hypothetical protein